MLEPQSAVTEQPQYVLALDVILVPVQDGTARLLDMSGRFYAVSALGARMLQDTLAQGTAAAVRSIAAQYRVDTTQVQRDVDTFLHELAKARLICHPLRRGRGRQASSIVTSLLLLPTLRGIYRCTPSLRSRAWALLTLARLALPLFGWARTVAVWQQFHRQQRTEKPSLPAGAARITAIDEAVRAAAARHLLTMECKERAVCCWSLARAAGLPATLVVGINVFPLHGHCWCEIDHWIISDDRDRCARFHPVVTYS